MRPTRRQVLAATVSSVAIAGCGGTGDGTDSPGDGSGGDGGGEDGGGENGGADGDGGENGGSSPDSTEGSRTVQVRSHPEHGDVLVDGDGMTLYMFDSDTRGEGSSTCSGGCAQAWPPLTVDGEPSAGPDVTGELTTFDRADGSTQVAANGWPLYYYVDDEEPGDVTGQGVNDIWWVLGPAGEPIR